MVKVLSKNLLPWLLIVALFITSWGGVFPAVGSAAAADCPTTTVGSGNGAAGGLMALGLLAILAGNHGPSSRHAVSGRVGVQRPTQPVKAPVIQPSQPSKPSQSSAGVTLSAEEQQAVNLMNADRRANGLPDLKVNTALTRLGENYAQDMINRNYFSHTNPEGQSPFDRMNQAGISYRYAGENIAINNSVSGAETAFMNSSGHRANILNPNYTEIGIGIRHDSRGSVYVVQEFIGR